MCVDHTILECMRDWMCLSHFYLVLKLKVDLEYMFVILQVLDDIPCDK